MIPLSVPHIAGNEWKYIKDCLDTGWVSSVGAYVSRFEEEICRYTGAKYAIACVNGTAALQTALKVAGMQPGEEVIVPTVTFIAPVNVVRYLDAHPVFMDCDDYYNLDIEKTIEFIKNEAIFKNGITINKSTDRRISAIIPVHVFGNAVDMESLLEFCRKRNIKIIEDATESLGTFYLKGPLKGSHTGTIGDIGCYSFNGNKIITTGGGGMIVTNNAEYAERARYLTTQAKDDPVHFIHNDIGYNFRLTNIQAAMGVAQLEQLPEYIKIKKRNYIHYKEQIDAIPGFHMAKTPDYADCNHWFYALQIEKDMYGKGRDKLMNMLTRKDIQTRPLWYLNHLQKPYRNCRTYRIEKAIKLWEKTLNLPCSINLDKSDIEVICGNISDE